MDISRRKFRGRPGIQPTRKMGIRARRAREASRRGLGRKRGIAQTRSVGQREFLARAREAGLAIPNLSNQAYTSEQAFRERMRAMGFPRTNVEAFLNIPQSKRGFNVVGSWYQARPNVTLEGKQEDPTCALPYVQCDKEEGFDDIQASRCMPDLLMPIELPSGRVWMPEPFDRNSLNKIENPMCLMFGSRRTGKSFFTRWLLAGVARGTWDWGIVITETKHNGFWQQYVPDEFIWEKYDAQRIAKIIERQKELLKQEENMAWQMQRNPFDLDAALGQEEDWEEGLQKNMFIIFDDVMGKATHAIKWDHTMTELGSMGRHFNISVFMLLQDPKAVMPAVRANTDWAFFFAQPSKRAMTTAYEDYMSRYISDKKDGLALLQAMTKEDNDPNTLEPISKFVCCVRMVAPAIDAESNIKIACAQDPGEFQLGSVSFWEKNEKIKEEREQQRMLEGGRADDEGGLRIGTSRGRMSVERYRNAVDRAAAQKRAADAAKRAGQTTT